MADGKCTHWAGDLHAVDLSELPEWLIDIVAELRAEDGGSDSGSNDNDSDSDSDSEDSDIEMLEKKQASAQSSAIVNPNAIANTNANANPNANSKANAKLREKGQESQKGSAGGRKRIRHARGGGSVHQTEISHPLKKTKNIGKFQSVRLCCQGIAGRESNEQGQERGRLHRVGIHII